MVKVTPSSTKTRDTNTRKASKLTKKEKASQLSSQSRAVSKVVRSIKGKGAKAESKMKYYTLKALTEYFENKYNVDASTEEGITIRQMKYRNKYLFPGIKQGKVYKKEGIIFDENEALNYLQTLARTLDKSDEINMPEVEHLDLSKKTISNNTNKNYNIILKKSSNMSTESEVESNDEK